MIFFLLLSLAFAQVEMAITVDDLPSHGQLARGTTRLEVAEKMLKVFKKHQVPQVYGFTNAERVFSKPELKKVLEAWVQAGYPLGNHIYSHPDLNKVSVADYQTEILQNEPMLKELSDAHDWKILRYPFLHEGETMEVRDAIRKFLFEHQYRIAQVTYDFEDWAWNTPYARCLDQNNKKSIQRLHKMYMDRAKWNFKHITKISNILFERPVKQILLLHIGGFTTETLDELLTFYKSQGVRFIPLTEAMKDPIYAFNPNFASRGGSEFAYQVMRARGLKAKDLDPTPPIEFPGKILETICQ